MSLSKYIEQFSKLQTNIHSGKKAPHKAILLLSVIELIKSNYIIDCRIELNNTLKAEFKSVWRQYVKGDSRFSPIVETPFMNLNSALFWRSVTYGKIARIDTELFQLLQDNESRDTLKNVLLKTYLTIAKHKVDFSKLDPLLDTGLYDYQKENKQKIYNLWQYSKSIMLQMPTGTGKTRLFVSIVKDLHNWGVKNKIAVKVLLLAHRVELIDQISKNISKYGLAHGVIMSSNIEQQKFPVQIASVPTLNRRMDRWFNKDFDLIIVDEAHHIKANSYKKILQEYPNAKVLGVTATPYRLNGAGFSSDFEQLIISSSVGDFIKRKYLSEYEYYSIAPTSETQKQINSIDKLSLDGDYLDSAMLEVVDTAKIRANIVSTYLKYAKGKKGIIYTINKEHNINICERLKESDVKAIAIDSDTPPVLRKEAIANFKAGKIDVLCNVNIFSEGFDCPDVEFILLARPTKSLSMFLQQIGRGLRISDNKEKVIFLDNVGLYNRFGLPSARRKWKHHFEGKEVTEYELIGEDEDSRDVIYIKDTNEGDEQVEMIHSSFNEVETLSDAQREIPIDYKLQFIYYLKNNHNTTKSTIEMYVSIVERKIDRYIRTYVSECHLGLFSIIDVDNILEIEKILKSQQDYYYEYLRSYNHLRAILSHYIKFAQSLQHPISSEKDNNNPSDKTTIDMKDLDKINETIAFLENNNYSIPKELLEDKQRLEEKQFLSIIPEIKTSLTSILSRFDKNLSFNVTYCDGEMNINLLNDSINDEIDNSNTPNSRKKIKVTFPDNLVIEEVNATCTFVEAIKVIGAKKVKTLNLFYYGFYLILDTNQVPSIMKQYRDVGDDLSINTRSTTFAKKKLLEKISESFNLDLKVELIETPI